jgi:hypothetical protein
MARRVGEARVGYCAVLVCSPVQLMEEVRLLCAKNSSPMVPVFLA